MDRTDKDQQAVKLLEKHFGMGRNEAAAEVVQLSAEELQGILDHAGGPPDVTRAAILEIRQAAAERREQGALQDKLDRVDGAHAATDSDDESDERHADLDSFTKRELLDFAQSQLPPIIINPASKVEHVRTTIRAQLADRESHRDDDTVITNEEDDAVDEAEEETEVTETD